MHNGGVAGFGSGEGPGKGGAAVHKVKIMNNYTGEESEVEVPEDRCARPPLPPVPTRRRSGRRITLLCLDCWPVAAGQPVLMWHCATLPHLLLGCSACRLPACLPACRYILFAAEEQGFELPFACRLGCCTACTVKVKEGSMYQPHSLGLSKGLRDLVSTSSCSSSLGHVPVRVLLAAQPEGL